MRHPPLYEDNSRWRQETSSSESAANQEKKDGLWSGDISEMKSAGPNASFEAGKREKELQMIKFLI